MTKLTISIDKRVREAAKIYARRNKTSISRLVENYLTSLMTRQPKKYAKSIEELLGFAELESPPQDLKEEKLAYLEKKYLNP